VSAAEFHKIFITGKNGQVGRELVERAAELGIEAISFGSEELDIRDRKAVMAAIDEHQPTVVINAAAYTAVDKAETEIDLAYAVNRDGVENLALACKAQNIPLIHISTDYVFDGEKNSPYVESDTPNPIGVYGASKYAGEEVLRATWEKHIIVRVSWVFGRYGNNFVKTMLRLGQERDALNVVGDQVGAPTAAADIANTALSIISDDILPWGLYHLESNPKVSWYEFATEVFSNAKELGLIAGVPVVTAITSDQFPTPVKRPAQSKLNSITSPSVGSVEWKVGLSNMLIKLTEKEGR
jgi:dTDP-4-dehydrorhamnose reductase